MVAGVAGQQQTNDYNGCDGFSAEKSPTETAGKPSDCRTEHPFASGPKRWRGFGGDYFKIKFHDGREVESTNLWCQGHIPTHYYDRLPDNAVFETAFAYRPLFTSPEQAND